MNAEENRTTSALEKIRESALLLSLATMYLCEAPFLKRFGREISLNLERLSGEIELLRKQFPGRFVKEVDTDDLLTRLHRHAERMQNPDQGTMNACGQGELGRALESDIDALSAAVHAVRSQVEGVPVPFGKKGAISAALESGAPVLSGIARRILKGLLLIILIAALAFAYLFFTMQKEGPMVEEMKAMESQLQAQEKVLAALDRDKAHLSEKTVALESKLLSGGEKIQLLELGVQIRSIDEKRRDIETDIATREEKLRSQQERIEKIQSKSFLKRLLRQ
jgi:hypothetical protein